MICAMITLDGSTMAVAGARRRGRRCDQDRRDRGDRARRPARPRRGSRRQPQAPRPGRRRGPDRRRSPARSPAAARSPSCSSPVRASIDRSTPARSRAALRDRLDEDTRVIVANDTLAVLRAGTPDAVGIAVPVSTGGNVIGRAGDGRVTDRGHGIFGGGYVLGALAARAARRGTGWGGARAGRWTRPTSAGGDDRPGPEAALLGAAVARAAERGDPVPAAHGRPLVRPGHRVPSTRKRSAWTWATSRPSSSTAGSGKPRPGWRPASGRPSWPECRAPASSASRRSRPWAPRPSPSMPGSAPRSPGTSRPAADRPVGRGSPWSSPSPCPAEDRPAFRPPWPSRPPGSPRAPPRASPGPARTSAGP